MMRAVKNFICSNAMGILVCLMIAVPSWLLGNRFPVVGGAVFSIFLGMIISLFWTNKGSAGAGIKFTSKYVLQAAVVLLGFGMDLKAVLRTGGQSLPIIVCTITTAFIAAYFLGKALRISRNITILIGVGSSICGGSAVAAAAPVIGADDDEIAQAISVIFFFNVIAAVLFPILGRGLGFDTTSGESFGIFAGTAVNDTSSVTAVASTWDSMWGLGTQTLDKAVTVKLIRTLAIIPITMALSVLRARGKGAARSKTDGFSLKNALPTFILLFVLASVLFTVTRSLSVLSSTFALLKKASKLLIIMAMAAIGLNSNIVKLIRSGGKSILLGGGCWICITVVSLLMQQIIWRVK